MNLHLSGKEARLLEQLLRDYLPDLKREVARTDARDFRRDLIERQDICERVIERLHGEAADARRAGGGPAVRTVPRGQWEAFFERVSRGLAGTRAEIEVASLDLGDQIATDWLPMVGVTYDPNDDLLDVALEGIDHLIRHPREILVREDAAGLESIAVLDEGGTTQIVTLKRRLTLPAVTH